MAKIPWIPPTKPDQNFPQPETSTPAPTPPDLRDLSRNSTTPTPTSAASATSASVRKLSTPMNMSVQSLVTHVADTEHLGCLVTHSANQTITGSSTIPLVHDRLRWVGAGRSSVQNTPEIDALIMAEMYALGFKRGSFQARNEGLRERHYLKGHTHTIEAPDAQQLRPRPGA
jgi:hypothetical protein